MCQQYGSRTSRDAQARGKHVFSGIGIVSNVVLNWILIFGKFGFPAMGIQGAAIATVLSGAIEIACLYSYLYGKKHLMAFGWQDIKAVIDWPKISRFLRLSLPTTFNFLIWAAGLLPTTLSWGRRGSGACCAIRHDSG